MSNWLNLALRLHQFLITLYPSEFRDEFGAEMREVFHTALTEVQFREGAQPWLLFWRELRDWPVSVIKEHRRARRGKMSANRYIEEKPLPRRELLAAMVIFLLPLLGMIASIDIVLPQWMDYFWLLVLWGAVLFALGLAIVKKLPRWSLSYLGFVVMVGIIVSQQNGFWGWIYPYFIQSFGPRSSWSLPIRITYVGIFELIMVTTFLLSGLILVNLLRLLPYTRGVWQGIRMNWTQLSFMFYGGLVFTIVLMFDEYRYEDIWKCIAWMCLALGAWLYLRADGQWQRILALMGGATGSMLTVALAKWVLIPLQEWPTGYPVAPSEASRWIETSSALISWSLIILLLLTPALLKLLPQTPGSIVSDEGDTITA